MKNLYFIFSLVACLGLIVLGLTGCDEVKPEIRPIDEQRVLVKRIHFRVYEADTLLFSIADSLHSVNSYGINISEPKNGIIWFDGAIGKYGYTPHQGFVGWDSVKYVITENNGLEDSAMCLIEIMARNTVCNSIVKADSFPVLERAPNFLPIFRNDVICPDAVITFPLSPPRSIIDLNDRGVTYNYTGPPIPAGTFRYEQFAYRVADPSGQISTGIVKLRVYGQTMPDCEEYFQPLNDRVNISRSNRRPIPITLLIGNDQACKGDIDTNSFHIDQPYTQGGVITRDSLDMRNLLYIPRGGIMMNSDQFVYRIKRKNSNTYKTARVLVVLSQ